MALSKRGYASDLSLEDLAERLTVCLGLETRKKSMVNAVLQYHQVIAKEARATKYQDDDSPQAERTFGVCGWEAADELERNSSGMIEIYLRNEDGRVLDVWRMMLPA